ncbi:MAG: hypothetical protein ACYTG7_07185 [Planctomycetota bacterium]|jgi:hypothetical protein
MFAIAITLIIPMCMAQTDGLGDVNWTMDVEGITLDNRLLGVEFDGENYWLTGAGGFIDPSLYEITPDGTLVNKYPQPPGNVGYWGWRDLTWDYQYLYSSSDSDQPHYIVQIDPTNGQKTGVAYGPFPVIPCRALAYQTSEDCFWTASFGSDIYQCFRDGSFISYKNPDYTLTGAGMEEFDPDHPKLWWLTQDGGGAYAYEFDPLTGLFTGKFFKESGWWMGGWTGGCAYNAGYGAWELTVVGQCSPDMLVAYDLDTPGAPLTTNRYRVSGWFGGKVVFFLDAGSGNADRFYGLFGSVSGTSPGTVLPGGMILPINWDFFTEMLTLLALSGSPLIPFFGNLDGDGRAEVVMTVPPRVLPSGGLSSVYAFCLNNPYDFVSNSVELSILGKP